jgi:hypothetical protein
MQLLLLCASFLPPWLAVYLLLARMCDSRGVAGLFLRGALAAGLSFGLCSCTFFLWLYFCGYPGNGFILAEALLWCALILFGVRDRKNSACDLAASPGRFYYALFYVVLLLGLAAFFYALRHHPHGGWDAWATWNLRARFLARGGEHWRDAFALSYSHVGYPLLLPAGIARLWFYLGDAPVTTPQLVAFMFTFATPLLLAGAVGEKRGLKQGLLAGVALLACCHWVTHGASQFADIPLAFFMLAAVALLTRAPERLSSLQSPVSSLVLAGLAAGMAAWTKNEGVIFLFTLILSRAVALIWLKKSGEILREMKWLLLGLSPLLVVIAIFKLSVISQQEGGDFAFILGKAVAPSRHLFILKEFALGILKLGYGLPVLLALYALLQKRGWEATCDSKTAGLSIILQLCGYYAAYVFTIHDLRWHIAESLPRLLLQILPVGIYALFIWCGEEGQSDKSGGSDAIA